MPKSPTSPGPKKLSEAARKVVAPSGIVSTGWPAVEHTCRVKLGVTFDPWQDGAGRLILAKRADGKLACMIGGVGMSLPRQVGKTYLIGAMVFALCINNPGLLVIWSAHHARTHGETFLAMQAFADRAKVKPYIGQVFKGSGDEEIRFGNGSRILFGARERGFGRGIPGVDMIVSDEAQIMSDKALDAQLATMNTSEFGLAIYVGTPPRPDDPSEAFTRMRTEAWKGELQDAAWIEFGANPDGNLTDRSQWAVANPSYPHRTPPESILRLQRKLTAESFLREGLGIWDEPDDDAGALSVAGWNGLEDAASRREGRFCIAFDIDPDRTEASIGMYGVRPDGLGHIELIERNVGTSWVVQRLVQLQKRHDPVAIVVGAQSPAAALAPDLIRAGVDLTFATQSDNARACGALVDAIDDKSFRHIGQADLTASIAAVKAKNSGDAFVWDRRAGKSITAACAVTLARWGYVATVPEPKPAPAAFFFGSLMCDECECEVSGIDPDGTCPTCDHIHEPSDEESA